MFIGHYGVAFAAKKVAPKVSLGTLFFAAQFIDLIWPILLLVGLEQVRIDPGNTAMTPLDFVSYPISHSLLMVIGWGVLVGGGYYFLSKSDDKKLGALILFCLVVSHWLLDLLTHRPDLPLAPGVETKVGLGLWNFPVIAVTLELLIFGAGVWLYFRTTEGGAIKSLIGFITFLLVVYLGNIFGPPPPDTTTLALSALLLWLLVALGYWIDGKRRARGDLSVDSGSSPE